jgi:hypothetical protein
LPLLGENGICSEYGHSDVRGPAERSGSGGAMRVARAAEPVRTHERTDVDARFQLNGDDHS